MKKLTRYAVLAVLGIALLVTGLANWVAVPLSKQPPLDPATPVHLLSGRVTTLREAIARSDIQEQTGDLPAIVEEELEPYKEVFGLDQQSTDLFELAEHNHELGDLDAALALYRSVPRSHPEYAAAQRIIGWKIYARQLEQPRMGVAYVNRSLRADPLEGNAWQDAYRIYLQALGF